MTLRIPQSLIILATFCGLYAYFYQGGGWNQNSRFDTTRALVETGRFEIGPYAANTGDVSRHGQRIYSNKAPGQSLLAAPVYWILFHLERALGLRIDDPLVAGANAHVLGFFTSGLPAAGLVWLLYVGFLRQGATRREAALLAGGFGSGSLILPYSGLLMNHNLVAFCLFAAWTLLQPPAASRRDLAAAGGLLGLAMASEPLALPAAACCAAYVLWVRRDAGSLAALSAGAAIPLAILLAYNALVFGNPLSTHQAQLFNRPDLLFGVLDWPQASRLYWLSFHPFRGLFYCCPVLLVAFFGLLRRDRVAGDRPPWPSADALARVAIALTFVVFNLSFNGWTGGWAVGPRYLIPAMPFLFSFALSGYRRLPRISAGLIVVSTVIMLAVSAVQVMVPSPDEGPPPPAANPVRDSLAQVLRGEVSVTRQSILENMPRPSPTDEWDSWNLGEVAGLRGSWSLLPVVLLLAAYYGHAVLSTRRRPGRRDPLSDSGNFDAESGSKTES